MKQIKLVKILQIGFPAGIALPFLHSLLKAYFIPKDVNSYENHKPSAFYL